MNELMEMAKRLKEINLYYFEFHVKPEEKEEYNKEPIEGLRINEIPGYFGNTGHIRHIYAISLNDLLMNDFLYSPAPGRKNAKKLEVYDLYLEKCPKSGITYHIMELVVSAEFVSYGVDFLTPKAKTFINKYLESRIKNIVKKNQSLCEYDFRFYQLVKSFPIIEKYISENNDYYNWWDEIASRIVEKRPKLLEPGEIYIPGILESNEEEVDYDQNDISNEKEVDYNQNDTSNEEEVDYDQNDISNEEEVDYNQIIRHTLTMLNYNDKQELYEKLLLIKKLLQKLDDTADFYQDRDKLLAIDNYAEEDSKKLLLSFVNKYGNVK